MTAVLIQRCDLESYETVGQVDIRRSGGKQALAHLNATIH